MQFLFFIAVLVFAGCSSQSGQIYPFANINPASPGDSFINMENFSSTRLWFSWNRPMVDIDSGFALERYDLRYSLTTLNKSLFESAPTALGGGLPVPGGAGKLEMGWIGGLQSDQTYFVAIRTLDILGNPSPVSNIATGRTGYGMTGFLGSGRDGWQISSHQDFSPAAVAINSRGEILVADVWGNRVLKFSSEGDLLGWIGGGVDGWRKRGIVKGGREDRFFSTPRGLAVDSEDRIYISDGLNHRVQRWTAEGVYEGWVGGGSTSGWRTGTAPASGSGQAELNLVYGLAIDAGGNIYVSDYGNHRIHQWSASGIYSGWIGGGTSGWRNGTGGGAGSGDAQMRFPLGVIADSDHLYVMDSYNYRVQKWTLSGSYQGWIGGGADGWRNGTAPSAVGRSDREFSNPFGGVVDPEGFLYIVDGANNRVQKWRASDGTYLGWMGGGSDGYRGGTFPAMQSSDRYFGGPDGVAFDQSGNLLVCDHLNKRLQKWTRGGIYLGSLGDGKKGFHNGMAYGRGSEDRYFYWPSDIGLDPDENIYVADGANFRIQKWNSAGEYLGWLGGDASPGWKTGRAPPRGNAEGQFAYVAGIAIDRDGSIYGADPGHFRVMKWDSHGNYLGWIGGGSNGWRAGNAPNGPGGGNGEFNSPESISVDAAGNLYITDRLNHRIQKWSSLGEFRGWIGGGADGWRIGQAPVSGSGERFFNHPLSAKLDPDGNIYLIDMYNNRIQRWSPDGIYSGSIGGGVDGWRTSGTSSSGAAGDRQFHFWLQSRLVIDSRRRLLYVSEDYYGNKVQKWTLDGVYLGWIGKGDPGWSQGDAPVSLFSGNNSQLARPAGMAIGPLSGALYIVDHLLGRVTRWE